MNLLLLEQKDFIDESTALIDDKRLVHLQQVLKAQVGDTLNTGLLNGKIGTSTINSLSDKSATLQVKLNQLPPAPLPLTIILALPRPKMLRRILRSIAELGIKDLYLINSYKVEKSYWQTPVLEAATIDNYLKEGLIQAKDTILPRVHIKKLFKPFVEDELKAIINQREAFVAHPYSTDNKPAQAYPSTSTNERVIAIGPEGGFIDYEIGLLQQQGLQPITLGNRIYRVENAITILSSLLSHSPNNQ